jgi:hypothetical protein
MGHPTTACSRLGCASRSRGFGQFERVAPAKESLVQRHRGEANRWAAHEACRKHRQGETIQPCSPSRTATALFILAALTACSNNAVPLLEQNAIAITWQALEPNTSSHDLSNWEVVEVRAVTGRDISDRFEGEPVPGRCAPGPTPPNNMAITPSGSYWYVQMRPRSATPLPPTPAYFSPTAPALVPEPFLYEVHFLINPDTSQIVARKLFCVIY